MPYRSDEMRPAPEAPAGFRPADLGQGLGDGFGPVFIDRERRLIAFRVAEQHLNPVGICHGGALTTFADIQLMAIRGAHEEGLPHSPTVSLSVDFLAPARLGDWVQSEVSLLQETRTLLFVQGLMTCGGRPIARASTIYRKHPSPGS